MKIEFELKDINIITENILEKIEKLRSPNKATVLLFYGDLGAGKTTISKTLAKKLGVREKVLSPTFVIMKKYKTKHKYFKNLIHIDAYRLEKGEELIKLGFKDWVLEEDNLIIIEWPENVSNILNNKFLKIFLKHKDDKTRLIEF
ncbi:TPA: tRNA (adenosine(37)-N6)-threonylcarbamoyltransferase complex ATPase subunit type 1 TsaE [Candidatus Nomurabacteria bacterium]|nr:MAG: hypothetical protein O210_OD1C00001G0587 [Parcubacteria bacterium RAAC4_OD1_1]HCY26191.1 tRNA (adenosine(37)-N6)-threonylcarbamoyltransferase complex ATPase subunit type 1 TsaE [Candidatus Nomurabacteria bacterium]